MTTLMPTSAWVSIMELLPPLCHGAGISGCGASSGSSPRCAAWWRTHHAHSRFPKENGGSLRPQLEQVDMDTKGLSQSKQTFSYNRCSRQTAKHEHGLHGNGTD